MNSSEIKLTHRVWMLLNRKDLVTHARLAKLIKKEPPMHALKRLEDAYQVTVEKTDTGYRLKETEAKKPVARKGKAKKTSKVATKKKTA